MRAIPISGRPVLATAVGSISYLYSQEDGGNQPLSCINPLLQTIGELALGRSVVVDDDDGHAPSGTDLCAA
jgi:hypothetical protein